MGDNRDRSSDSRYWGTVPRSMIKGRAFMVYWSFDGHAAAARRAADRARQGARRRGLATSSPRPRWERTFFIVDSKYHYHPEPEGETGESP